MVIENSRYCNFCRGIILFGQKHVQFRIAGTDGKSQFDYIHFHHRFKGDCWEKQSLYRHDTAPTPAVVTSSQLPTVLKQGAALHSADN